jgi:hypothetical protein
VRNETCAGDRIERFGRLLELEAIGYANDRFALPGHTGADV